MISEFIFHLTWQVFSCCLCLVWNCCSSVRMRLPKRVTHNRMIFSPLITTIKIYRQFFFLPHPTYLLLQSYVYEKNLSRLSTFTNTCTSSSYCEISVRIWCECTHFRHYRHNSCRSITSSLSRFLHDLLLNIIMIYRVISHLHFLNLHSIMWLGKLSDSHHCIVNKTFIHFAYLCVYFTNRRYISSRDLIPFEQ